MGQHGNGVLPTRDEWRAIAQIFGWGHREMETVRLVVQGMARKAAAAHLGIAPSTLQTHLRRALRKARADDVIDLLWGIVALRDRHRVSGA